MITLFMLNFKILIFHYFLLKFYFYFIIFLLLIIIIYSKIKILHLNLKLNFIFIILPKDFLNLILIHLNHHNLILVVTKIL